MKYWRERPNVNCSGTSTNYIILGLECDVNHKNNGVDLDNISVYDRDDNCIGQDELIVYAIIINTKCEDVDSNLAITVLNLIPSDFVIKQRLT